MRDEISRIIKEEHIPIKKVNTIIGVNTIFRGNFVVEGPLRVDGNYEGNIKSLDLIIVGSSGKVKGDIFGETVVVGGKVKGNIFAIREIILLGTSSVIGDLSSQKILIDEGARFKGRFNRVGKEEIMEIFSAEVSPYLEEERKKWSW
ncbi:MAG: polymer-forming cytoskeletal protein [Brevinematia bacterium]